MSLWISGIAMPLTEKAATIITTPGAVCRGMNDQDAPRRLRPIEVGPTARRLRALSGADGGVRLVQWTVWRSWERRSTVFAAMSGC